MFVRDRANRGEQFIPWATGQGTDIKNCDFEGYGVDYYSGSRILCRFNKEPGSPSEMLPPAQYFAQI